MRIALVCPYDWSRPGGVQAHVAGLAGHLATRHQVRVVAPSSEPETDDPWLVPVGRPVPVPFNQSRAPVALSPTAWLRTRRMLAGLVPDVVHVHEPLAPLVSTAATTAAGRPGFPPVVGTFHSWSDRNRLYRLGGPLGRRALARLAAATAVSPAARDYAAGVLGVAPERLTVVPNGVDARFYHDAVPFPDLVDRDRPLLLFVGRLEPRKGCELAVRAFLQARRRRPGVRLCVVGDGSQRRHCEELVPAEARGDVSFVGSVTESDKARFYASADLLVAPNLGGESFGIVLLEAMAAGLPVVASDIPGFRTLAADGSHGYLVPPGDGTALAEAVERVLADPVRAAGMAAECRRTAETYAWPRVGARMENLYRALAPPSSPLTGGP